MYFIHSGTSLSYCSGQLCWTEYCLLELQRSETPTPVKTPVPDLFFLLTVIVAMTKLLQQALWNNTPALSPHHPFRAIQRAHAARDTDGTRLFGVLENDKTSLFLPLSCSLTHLYGIGCRHFAALSKLENETPPSLESLTHRCETFCYLPLPYVGEQSCGSCMAKGKQR